MLTEEQLVNALLNNNYVDLYEVSNKNLSNEFITKYYQRLDLKKLGKVFFLNNKVVHGYKSYSIKRTREDLLSNPYKFLKHSKTNLREIANEVIKGNFLIIDNQKDLDKKLLERKKIFAWKLSKVLRNDPFKSKAYKGLDIYKVIYDKLNKNPDLFYDLLMKVDL